MGNHVWLCEGGRIQLDKWDKTGQIQSAHWQIAAVVCAAG